MSAIVKLSPRMSEIGKDLAHAAAVIAGEPMACMILIGPFNSTDPMQNFWSNVDEADVIRALEALLVNIKAGTWGPPVHERN